MAKISVSPIEQRTQLIKLMKSLRAKRAVYIESTFPPEGPITKEYVSEVACKGKELGLWGPNTDVKYTLVYAWCDIETGYRRPAARDSSTSYYRWLAKREMWWWAGRDTIERMIRA